VPLSVSCQTLSESLATRWGLVGAVQHGHISRKFETLGQPRLVLLDKNKNINLINRDLIEYSILNVQGVINQMDKSNLDWVVNS